MTEKVGFISALWGTCCGTGIFDRLRQVSWGRTIWHLFLLCLLVGIAVGKTRSHRFAPWLQLTENAVVKTFGAELQFADGAFWPSRDPGQSRTLDLPWGGRLCYTGVGQTSVLPPASELKQCPFFVLWSGKHLVNISQIDDSRWSVLERSAAGNLTMQVESSYSGLKKYFTRSSNPAVPPEATPMATADLFQTIRTVGTLWLILGMMGQAFVVTWLYTGLFMLVFRFTGSRNMRSMTGSEMWKCGIYAGFPALLVAMCFPLFDLPYLTFDTVYMLGLMIYWMVVTGRIERDARRNNNADVQ